MIKETTKFDEKLENEKSDIVRFLFLMFHDFFCPHLLIARSKKMTEKSVNIFKHLKIEMDDYMKCSPYIFSSFCMTFFLA